MNQSIQFLKSLPLFEKCDAVDLQRMALSLRWHSHRKGETLLFQGMISHQMYFVVSGRVGVFSRKNRETVRVAELGPGDYFGEISLLSSRAATATVKAEEDETQVYVLDREVIVDALSRHPEAMADVTAKIQERNTSRSNAFDKTKETVGAPA